MHLRKLLALAGAGLATGVVGVAPAGAVGGHRSITVDASSRAGDIRSLQGVSGTPLPGDASHPDYTAGQNALGIDIVRTHDIDCQGTGDLDGAGVNRVFPDWTKDPNDPASYNFAPTDRAVLSIVHSGAQVEYSLGRSDLRCAGIDTNNAPAPAPDLYAVVAKHVAMHFNDGWANGYHLHIRYWEFWNEPDLIPFWTGTPQELYALYAATSRALKSLHPWMQIGGPALATDNDLTGYRDSLLAYIRANHLPLDFWNIHHYTDFLNDPMDFPRLAQENRQLLDQYGFHRVPIQLTEWNYALVDQPSAAQRAAFAASSLVYMQDAPIDRAFFYRYNADGGFGLAAQDGTLSKTGEAYEAVGALSHTDRLKTAGGDQNGLAVEAGRLERRNGEVRVLISNYEIPPQDRNMPFPPIPLINGNLFTVPGTATFTLLTRRGVTYADNSGYDLTVKNIHGGQSGLVIKRYRVDDTHDLSLVDSSTTRSSTVHLSADLPAPAVELVVIKRVHGAATRRQ